MFAGVAEMMGRQTGGQERLFYSFNLETVVPENHLLRGINRCLDLGSYARTWLTITAPSGGLRSIRS